MSRSSTALLLGCVVLWPSCSGGSQTSGASGTTRIAGPSTSRFVSFAGRWGGHGQALDVSASGHGTAYLRAYALCGVETVSPCDDLTRQPEGYAYHVRFGLTSIQENVAQGTIQQSNDPDYPVGPMTLTLLPGDQVGLRAPPQSDYLTFCGPHAVYGACGA